MSAVEVASVHIYDPAVWASVSELEEIYCETEWDCNSLYNLLAKWRLHGTMQPNKHYVQLRTGSPSRPAYIYRRKHFESLLIEHHRAIPCARMIAYFFISRLKSRQTSVS